MALFTFERYFGSSEASKPHFNVLLSLLYVCPKDVFLDKPKIAFFAFKIRTGEYILCSFGLCVTKVIFSPESKMALFTFERYFGSFEAY